MNVNNDDVGMGMGQEELFTVQLVPEIQIQMTRMVEKVSEESPETPLSCVIYTVVSEVLKLPALRPQGAGAVPSIFAYYMPIYKDQYLKGKTSLALETTAYNHAACGLIENYLHNLDSNKSRRLCMMAIRIFPEVFSELLQGNMESDPTLTIAALMNINVIANSIKYYTRPIALDKNLPYLKWLLDFFRETLTSLDTAKIAKDPTMVSAVEQISSYNKFITV